MCVQCARRATQLQANAEWIQRVHMRDEWRLMPAQRNLRGMPTPATARYACSRTTAFPHSKGLCDMPTQQQNQNRQHDNNQKNQNQNQQANQGPQRNDDMRNANQRGNDQDDRTRKDAPRRDENSNR
jgi:hypothetical protein